MDMIDNLYYEYWLVYYILSVASFIEASDLMHVKHL